MKVNNINGTSQNKCNCGSWLAHWERFTGESIPAYCPELGCMQKPEVGAHVQKDGSTDRNWYIIPLCNTHNKQVGGSLIVSDISLASANVANTCGKY